MERARTFRLGNGIKIVSQEMRSVESATLGFWVKAGGVTEGKDNYGISHFLEHMVFKGTTHRSAKRIAEDIENVGGYLNAYTSRNVTAFHSKVLKGDISLAIDVLSDMIINPTFPSDELEKERGVVLQEIGQTIDDPNDIIFDYFQGTAFPEQAMGRPILGSVEIVSKLGASDLRAYRDRFYTSDAITFSIAGNFRTDEVIDLVGKCTGGIGCREFPEVNIDPIYVGGYFSDFRPKLEQTHVILGFNGIKYTDDDYYVAALFSSILGEGMSSRLFQEVREKRGLVYSIYSFNSCYRDAGLFGIYAATSAEKVEELLDVAYAEVLKMRENIGEKEFRRTKAQFKANMLMSRESTASICEQIASQAILFGEPIRMEDILEKIDSVSIEMVERYTERVLSSKPTLVTVGKVNCGDWIGTRIG